MSLITNHFEDLISLTTNRFLALELFKSLWHDKDIMMIDVPKLEAEIQKLEEALQRLRDLHKFVTNPEAANLLEKFASNNGSRTPVVAVVQPEADFAFPVASSSLSRGDLTRAVLDACKTISGKFTVKDIIGKMQGADFVFEAKLPEVSVNGVLRKLVKRNIVGIVSAGGGRTPTVYELKSSAVKQKPQVQGVEGT